VVLKRKSKTTKRWESLALLGISVSDCIVNVLLSEENDDDGGKRIVYYR
jgi:hypothetical protein